MEIYKFDCNGHNAPAYSCNKPGDNSGEYVRVEDVLPERLTAENGAKAALMGEFFESVEMSCSACYFHGPQLECEVCGGDVEWKQKVPVSWTTIKAIWKKAVDHFRR